MDVFQSRMLWPLLAVALVLQSSVIADSRPVQESNRRADGDVSGIRLVSASQITGGALASQVALENFVGMRKGNTVELEWTTTREFGNQGFEVQRASSTSRGWERLSFVPGIGRSSMEQHYMFDDRHAPPEDLRYMLRILGSDGMIQYSQIISVPAGSVLRSFIINGPTPSYGKLFTAEIKLASSVPVTLHLVDYVGNVLLRTLNAEPLKQGINTVPIDCSKLPAGSYEMIAYTPHAHFSRTLTIK